jgi:hypothetical protein
LVEWAWGMSKRYISELKRQLRNATVGSDTDDEIFETMLHFPVKDEDEKLHVSVIDNLDLATRTFTPARVYAINTLRGEKRAESDMGYM